MSVAENHDGVVSSRAAREAGISPSALYKMAKRGRLQRISRGLYRLIIFPISASKWSEFHEAIGWARSSMGPPAAISHESALVLHEISDAMPSKIHISIPKRSRFQRRTIPPRIEVHSADIDPTDLTEREGIPVTTVRRTILDVIVAGRTDLASQAIRDAAKAGILTTGDKAYLDWKLQLGWNTSAR